MEFLPYDPNFLFGTRGNRGYGFPLDMAPTVTNGPDTRYGHPS